MSELNYAAGHENVCGCMDCRLAKGDVFYVTREEDGYRVRWSLYRRGNEFAYVPVRAENAIKRPFSG